MEKRIITLEVQVEQITKSIDRLDRSIETMLTTMDRRFTELDRKFMWCVRTQVAALIAIIGLLAKLANLI
jgi:tetrahydromethanopterin S-methyltransferase subunit B